MSEYNAGLQVHRHAAHANAIVRQLIIASIEEYNRSLPISASDYDHQQAYIDNPPGIGSPSIP